MVLSDHFELIPSGIIPIACTDGYDLVCLDLRQESAPIVCWDRRSFWGTDVWSERDLHPVADNFEALLASLVDLPTN